MFPFMELQVSIDVRFSNGTIDSSKLVFSLFIQVCSNKTKAVKREHTLKVEVNLLLHNYTMLYWNNKQM